MNINSKITRNIANELDEKTLCAYQNLSSNWQIVKITNLPNYYWERAVLPGQKIIFVTSIKAILKVFSAENITAILIDNIPCDRLKIN
ncbi:MAG: DUF1830 domain-containing protein [Pleurocapsa minor HA4230-MV1]|jgi:hypothetical protein|nr:DUF1830 domain-containing protein [Pleurocapsa minor HA4230-MV1]